MPRPKRNHRSAGLDHRGRNRDLADATRLGDERHCPTARKRSYSSRGQAIRAGTERYGQTAEAYRCRDCGLWHCTRAYTPLDERTVEPLEPSCEAAADALVDALGIGEGE